MITVELGQSFIRDPSDDPVSDLAFYELPVTIAYLIYPTYPRAVIYMLVFRRFESTVPPEYNHAKNEAVVLAFFSRLFEHT